MTRNRIKRRFVSMVALFCAAVLVLSTGLVGCARRQAAIGNSAVFPCGQVTGIPQVECDALVALYKSTSGMNWEDSSNWIKTNAPCNWSGVACSDGHVDKLNLSLNNLVGGIPAEIGHLSHLTELRLDDNAVTSLPSAIGNLPNLTDLYLAGNELTSLPPEIGNLSNLISLYLDDNQLTSLPPEIGNLSSLTQLYLGSNQLTVIPPEIGNLSNLTDLDLGFNQLSSLPSEIGSLSTLTALDLNGNPFTGTVPASITKLSKLSQIQLSSCSGLTSSDPQVIAWLDARSPGWNQCP